MRARREDGAGKARTRRGRTGLAVILAGLAGVGVCAARDWTGPRHATPATSSAAPAMDPAAHFELPARVGERSRHPMQLDLDVTVSPGVLLGFGGKEPHTTRMSVKGTLVDLAVDAFGRSLLSVEEPAVETNGARDADAERALRTGIVVDHGPHGAVTRVRFPRGTKEAEASLLRALAFAVEWTPPESAPTPWTAEEASVDGPADVSYAMDGSALTRRVERARARAGSPLAAGLTAHGELRLDVDLASRRWLDVHGGWGSRRVDGEGTEAVRADVHVSIDAGPVDRDVGLATGTALSLARVFDDWTELDAPIVDPGAAARRMDELAASTTVDQALASLRSSDPAAAARAAVALQALIERNPAASAAVARDILAAGLRDRAARTELSLLAGVGNPGAQRAITDVVRGTKGSGDVATVLPLLGQVKEPTSETADFLRALRKDPTAPDLARSATVTLGSMANNLAATDPAGADAIAQSFEEQLRGASGLEDTVDALAALGNTRSPRILDDAQPYLQSDDTLVRRAAATALGQSPDPEATTLLEQLSTADTDPRVRAAAARALARRGAG